MDQERHRLLFLDIDGVLIVDGGGGYGFDNPDPVLVGRVKSLADRAGVKIILSSLWRLSGKKRTQLSQLGLTLHGCTPELSGRGRAAEIAAYVASFRRAHTDAEIDYVIFDDDDGAGIAGHFYLCDPETGLTDEIARSVHLRWSGW